MKTYKVNKGQHDFGFQVSLFYGTKMAISGSFNENCIYDLGDSDQSDINKLAGFSRLLHHKDSARIGWRSVKVEGIDKIQLVTYCYSEGVRIKEKHLIYVSPNEKFEATLEDLETEWKFTIYTLNSNNSVTEKKSKKSKLGYVLFPYFGGNKTAPHDMEITLNIKKLK
jgi:hypothetical protein